MMFSRRFQAYLAAILFSSIIGFSFMFVKMSIHYADPLDVLADRFAIAFVFSMIFLLLRKAKLSLKRSDVLPLLLLALLNSFLYFLTQALGLVYLPASEAGIIQATLPIFTIIFAALFLKEKTNLIQKIAVATSVLGVMFIFVMNDIQFGYGKWTGIALILVSTITYAGYNVLARGIVRNSRMVDMTYLMIIIGFISFTVMSLGHHLIQGTLLDYFKPFLNPWYLISESYLGLLASLTTFFYLTSLYQN